MGSCCSKSPRRSRSEQTWSPLSNSPPILQQDCDFNCKEARDKCFSNATQNLMTIREQVQYTEYHKQALDESMQCLLHIKVPPTILSEIAQYLEIKYPLNSPMQSLYKPITCLLRECYAEQLDLVDMGCNLDQLKNDQSYNQYFSNISNYKTQNHLNNLLCSKWFKKKYQNIKNRELKINLITHTGNNASTQRIGLRYTGKYNQYFDINRGRNPIPFEWDPNEETTHCKYLSMDLKTDSGQNDDNDDNNDNETKFTVLLSINELSWGEFFQDEIFYSGNILIYVYNVRHDSLEEINHFMLSFAKNLDKMVDKHDHDLKHTLVLCASGCDNAEENDKNRIVSTDEGISIAKQYNVPYIEVSSFVDYNVTKLFDLALLEWWYTDCFHNCPYIF